MDTRRKTQEATSKCAGSGQQGVPAQASVIYPACPVCGREFSAQGRKAQARIGNAWNSIPAHYEATR